MKIIQKTNRVLKTAMYYGEESIMLIDEETEKSRCRKLVSDFGVSYSLPDKFFLILQKGCV